MSLKFCANLSFMFEEFGSLTSRYAAARSAGFKAVECAFPYDYSIEAAVKAKSESGLQQILINSPPGDVQNGEFGLAALPGRENDFRESLKKALEYAKALDCKRLHIMSGKYLEGTNENTMMSTLEENLKFAAKSLEANGIVGLIEPINKYSLPQYFLNSFDKGMSLVKKIKSPYLRLQLDIFHLQIICGDLNRNIKEFLPYVGHIQIAQVPDRHEPNSDGEINYGYILKLLDDLHYDGWIGLEYKPAAGSKEGLTWIKEMGYQL